jgi:NADH dehydrogenase (ubiquinone) 1 alpha/beta subcomplex 1
MNFLRQAGRSSSIGFFRSSSFASKFASPAAFQVTFVRKMSGRPEKSEFENRALELLRGFEKIDPQKLTLAAHFTKDLGLDSLDTVEVIMAIEDEFLVEIPDKDADDMHTVQQAVDFVYERLYVE